MHIAQGSHCPFRFWPTTSQTRSYYQLSQFPQAPELIWRLAATTPRQDRLAWAGIHDCSGPPLVTPETPHHTAPGAVEGSIAASAYARSEGPELRLDQRQLMHQPDHSTRLAASQVPATKNRLEVVG